MSALLRLAIWLGIILTVGLFLYLLAPVLTPFLAAALLAYLGDPVTDRLQKFRISRTSAVIIVFVTLLLGLLLLFLLFVPLLEGQVSAMLRRLPGYLDLLQERGLP
ncbi:MAG: AI-2E family transporter, partial [Candidatus Competibacteraceae bacterium]|nr:AI-2E family transporter [Candidatus Competibacteraceae bacterium]